MADAITCGRALFYPHINFTNEKWIKTAALYYKGLNRIVPEGYQLVDNTNIIMQLNEDEEFVRNINPRDEAEYIAKDFLNFAKKELATKIRREQLINSISTKISLDNSFSIHMFKLGDVLQRELPKLGLAVKNQDPQKWGWFDFEPVTGAMYMTCLANYIAQKEQIPVVTDDQAFHPLIRGIQIERFRGNYDVGETLASMVIQTVVPENIEDIPISKILKFRKNYDDERHLFYNEINRLVKELEVIDNKTTLQDCLEEKKKDIEIAVKNLERSYRGMGISTVTAMLGLSIPKVSTGLSAGLAAAGLVVVATEKLLQQGNDYYKIKKESPYSYVLTLKHNLKAKTLAEQLLSGNIVF